NFYVHQIKLPYSIKLPLPKKRTLLAYLDIESKNGEKHRVYIGCDDILIQCIAEIFLGEELSDTETLKDMLLEITNMIVGSAKVLAQEQMKNSFTISTPHFFDHNQFTLTTDENYIFTVGEGEMIIAIKAL
ncbi:MAG: chemotaxis protein CheX, partial [Sulfuricurvum sp.]